MFVTHDAHAWETRWLQTWSAHAQAVHVSTVRPDTGRHRNSCPCNFLKTSPRDDLVLRMAGCFKLPPCKPGSLSSERHLGPAIFFAKETLEIPAFRVDFKYLFRESLLPSFGDLCTFSQGLGLYKVPYQPAPFLSPPHLPP